MWVKWLFSYSHEETEEQPCMEEGEVQIFFLITTIISFVRRDCYCQSMKLTLFVGSTWLLNSSKW